MKPIVIIVIAFVLLISSVTPYANAEPLQIIQECSNNSHILKISNPEGPVKNVSVHIYTNIGMVEYEGKVVSNENGEVEIKKSSRNNVVKISKGGYNDTTIFLECPSLKPEPTPESILTESPLPTITPVILDGIPDWVKNTVGWWADDQLKDEEFINSIGFLIKNEIITLPKTESVDGVSSDMIFNLIPNENLELVFDGGVIPVPVSPVFLELTDPNGILTEKNQMIGSGGHYSFSLQFSDDSILGIYDVKLFFNHKLIKSEFFKLEKAVSKNTTIPDWVKNNAIWWAQDKIDEKSFISGIQYLVNDKIIILETNDIGRSHEKNIPSSKYKSTHIENFPDSLKTPEYYLDRYYGEEEYQKWFDKQFPNTTIYEILGLISHPKEIMGYVIPSKIFGDSLGITKSSNVYSTAPIEGKSNFSSKFGDLKLTVIKSSSKTYAEDLFRELSLITNLTEPYFFQNVSCYGNDGSIGLCVYDKYLVMTNLSIYSNADDNKLNVVILDKVFQNISMLEHLDYESKIHPLKSDWQFSSLVFLLNPFTFGGIVNVDEFALNTANSQTGSTISNTEGFSGLYCTSTEYGSVKMTGQYTNGPDSYSTIYFTLGILDHNGRIVATGLGYVSNIGPYQTKIFEASAGWDRNFKECIIEIDKGYP